MAVKVHWFGHASFRITGSKTIFIDPWKLPKGAGHADVILVSHSHYDHLSPPDVAALRSDATTVLVAQDCVGKLGEGVKSLTPGQTCELPGITIVGVRAYNIDKDFHPKANDWLGLIVELDGKRIYYAGDTDEIPEMSGLGRIDLALLPVGGTYTMNAAQAAHAAKAIQPARALPYHWGDIVGGHGDAEAFRTKADCPVIVLSPGSDLSLD
jgi:L-ascorbate metabolism protein UlaG (beta-lactamase superfamily)